jgi:hypothetical protein
MAALLCGNISERKAARLVSPLEQPKNTKGLIEFLPAFR